MALTARRPLYVAAIVERFDNHLLIESGAKREDGTGLWRFPRGRAAPGESAEAAMRRVAKEWLGIEVEIVVGQPPLVERVDGDAVELRYFFCGILRGEPAASEGGELRWVSRGHLREYEFDGPSRAVAEWLVES